jgi:hypothetical protein
MGSACICFPNGSASTPVYRSTPRWNPSHHVVRHAEIAKPNRPALSESGELRLSRLLVGRGSFITPSGWVTLMGMMTICGRGLGQRRPLFEDFSVPPPVEVGDGGPVTLRDLITHVVCSEVAAFEKRQEARRLDRVLTARQIEQGRERGKIGPEGRDPKHQPPTKVDLESAVATALEAFVDGLYLVILDGIEYRDLDAIVLVEPDSRMTFLRLTFLAGA